MFVAVQKYIEQFPELIQQWGKICWPEYAVDKVVVDIVPWALTAAK
jgi:RecB family endonuclease NucS